MFRLLSLLIVIGLLALSVTPVAAQQSNYVVQTGDTLLQIAIKFNTSIAAIKLTNNLNSDLIFIGQTLKIPGTTPTATVPTTVTATTAAPTTCPQQYSVKSGDTLKIISERCQISLATLIAANQLLNPDLIFVGQTLVLPTSTTTTTTITTKPSVCGTSYTVQRGDFLNAIAEKCQVNILSLIAANNLINANLIFAGQTLIMPGAGNTVAPATTAPPAPVATATSSPLIIGGVPLNNPTATPKPSSSSGAVVNTSRGLVGELTLCNPEKPTFAIKIERICFRMKITNPTSNKINYSILGVQATNLSGGANQFQSSWRGDLSVAANSVGPTGSGWEDGIYIQNAGTYALQLSICYAVSETCFAGSGWEILTPGVNVTAIYWVP